LTVIISFVFPLLWLILLMLRQALL